jgi:glutamate/aspartate transport system substrate-binding protein
MKQLFVIVSVPLALTLAPTVKSEDQSTLEKIRNTGVITIAYRESSIPISYVDGNKRPIGYAIELCMRVVSSLRRDLKIPDLQVRYLPVSSDQRMIAVAQGKADLECGTTTNTAARRKQVAFSIPHYFAFGRFLVRANSGILSIQDLRGKRIVTNRGSTHAARLQRDQKAGVLVAHVSEAADSAQSFAMVERGEADAFLFDDIVLYSLRAASSDPTAFAIVGESVSAEPQAIMLRRNDPQFKRFVDGVLTRTMVDGEAEILYRRWFQSPIPPSGLNLQVPLNHILWEQFQFPSDKVGDAADG